MLEDMEPVDYFPRGLIQPEGSFRFGEDALLLAALTAKFSPPAGKVAELGCGCGAALAGLLLLWPEARGLGLDNAEALLAAARENANLLNLSARCEFSQADFTVEKYPAKLPANIFDAAMANPPWQKAGRPAKTNLREQALRSANPDIMRHFFRAAAHLLRHKGRFYLILPAEALAAAIIQIEGCGLGLRFVQPLKTGAHETVCERIFIQCQKGAKHDVKIYSHLDVLKPDGAPRDWPDRAFRIL